MKTYSQFILDAIEYLPEAWHPPFKPLPGSGKTPMAKARNAKVSPEKQELVRTSVKRFGSAFNDAPSPEHDIKSKEGQVTIRSKSHPEMSVSYTQVGDKHHVQNTTVSSRIPDERRQSAGREMQRLKDFATSRFRPGEKISSQPIDPRRGSLNTRTQGMSEPDASGYQHGTVRHLSPKQKANKTKPLLATSHSGPITDPNHA